MSNVTLCRMFGICFGGGVGDRARLVVGDDGRNIYIYIPDISRYESDIFTMKFIEINWQLQHH